MRRLLGIAFFDRGISRRDLLAFSPRPLPEFPATGLRIDTLLVQDAVRAGSRLARPGRAAISSSPMTRARPGVR